MPTSSIQYLGDLRTEATHNQSGISIITDAPVDNQGKGEAFSPTDLVATALGNCMLTLMGIACNNHQIPDIKGTTIQIQKHMGTDPRRIIAIDVDIQIADRGLSDKQKEILQRAALTCPVAKSLHPDINQNITFSYINA